MTAYTGVGSRVTPVDVLLTMRTAATHLAELGYTLRTGGAEGADQHFFHAAHSRLGEIELYLPWPGFWAPHYAISEELGVRVFERPSNEAYKLAERFHPNWRNLRHSVRSLHARNVHQVLGPNLDAPAHFVLCWTPGGSGSGGTGQAIRIAGAHRIPVLDLGQPRAEERLRALLVSYGAQQTRQQPSVITKVCEGAQAERPRGGAASAQ